MFGNSRKKIVNKFRDKVKLILKENSYTQNYIPYQKTHDDYIIKKSKINYPLCDYGLPIPPVELRSGYESDNAQYINSSHKDTASMISILRKSDFQIENAKRILDFGCSSGRMTRSLKPYSESCEIWGTDVSADHIYWNNQYLNPPFHFATTTFNPHLPFEDKYFDLIYSGSVFTHIDNLIEGWLLELKRIVSDEGRIYLTIHDNHTLGIFLKNENIPLSKYMESHHLYDEAREDFDFFVFNRSRTPQVFFDIEYFAKLVKPLFEIISVNHESYGYQTGVLLKRKK
jgi:SAM-dependent methyltransferase